MTGLDLLLQHSNGCLSVSPYLFTFKTFYSQREKCSNSFVTLMSQVRPVVKGPFPQCRPSLVATSPCQWIAQVMSERVFNNYYNCSATQGDCLLVKKMGRHCFPGPRPPTVCYTAEHSFAQVTKLQAAQLFIDLKVHKRRNILCPGYQ